MGCTSAGLWDARFNGEKGVGTLRNLHAMESYPDDAALVKHGCYVLFRGCNTPGHSESMNARCITAVLSALSLFPQDNEVVYAGFAALTPLFWAHKHGDSTVRGIETVLQCMQVQTVDLQARTAVERDINIITLHGYLDSTKILFAGLDVLCKLLHVDKNPFKRHGVPSYKSIFPTLQGFAVVRVAHALLLELGAGIGPWDKFCDDARTFPFFLSPHGFAVTRINCDYMPKRFRSPRPICVAASTERLVRMHSSISLGAAV